MVSEVTVGEALYSKFDSGETEIAFKGARITALFATNTALRYKVVSGIP